MIGVRADAATRQVDRDITLDIEGMTCASCVNKVERALGAVDGVDAAAVNLATRTATVRASSDALDPLLDAVRTVGYVARPHSQQRSPLEEVASYRRRLLVAAPLTLAILALTFVVPDWPPAMWVAWALATPVQFYAGWPFLLHAARAARHGNATMDTLVALGSLAAYGYSAWAVLAAAGDPMAGSVEHYFDTGAVIITLILVGKMLEARARLVTAKSSQSLLGCCCGFVITSTTSPFRSL